MGCLKFCAWNTAQLFCFFHIQGFSQLYSAVYRK